MVNGPDNILDGKAVAKTIRQQLESQIQAFQTSRGYVPNLAVVLPSEEPDACLYAQNLQKWFQKLGLGCFVHQLSSSITQEDLCAYIRSLCSSVDVHGVMIQMPLPDGVSYLSVAEALDPMKDVEGIHPYNFGLLSIGNPQVVPSTPMAAATLIDHYGIDVSGKNVVVIGRSNVVGKPFAQLMLMKHASVSVLHSRSKSIRDYTLNADIVAVAVGRPNTLTADMVREGVIVIDFGINFVNDRLVGDVDFEAVSPLASFITPVPGGIGPLTNLMLASNLIKLALTQP